MSAAKTSLADELAPIQVQIKQEEEKLRRLEGDLRTIVEEIELFSADKRRFDALRDVCTALDTLGELGAGPLFWDELLDGPYVAGHLSGLREHIAGFEEEIRGTQEKHEAFQAQINKQHYELNFLHEEVRQAYAREERRNEEFLIEREISPIPYRDMVMPWNNQDESEKRFRFAMLVAFSLSIVFCSLIPLWKLPVPDRMSVVEIPERLAMLVKKEQAKPVPLPKVAKEKKVAKGEKKAAEQVKEDRSKPASTTAGTPATTSPETQGARQKAESSGVLAFKESFSDLLDVTPIPKLGVQSHLLSQSGAAGQASRSLVAMQSAGGSGGIGNAAVSRNIGNGGGTGNGTGSGGGSGHGGSGTGTGNGTGTGTGNRLGGVGVARVESTVAGLTEEARPLSTGTGPARTDEEIQIVFDKYKATLYRIYNAELRKNPTLRGKMILRLTIEPGGEVSACTVPSTDLASPELVAQIVDRVKKFNFGPKEKVPTTTILYPIDFLPAG